MYLGLGVHSCWWHGCSRDDEVDRVGRTGVRDRREGGVARGARGGAAAHPGVVRRQPPASGASSDELPADLASALDDAVCQLLRGAPPGERLAVRSSALEEDGARHSFAGQFESYLFVAPEDVPARVQDVWRSAASGRVDAYRREHALEREPRPPAVLVQRMVDADASGVAFSADPCRGSGASASWPRCTAWATSLVSGEANADTFRVDRGGTSSSGGSPTKRHAHRAGRRRRRRGGGAGRRVEQAGDRRRSGARRRGTRARERGVLRPAAGHRVGHRGRAALPPAVARRSRRWRTFADPDGGARASGTTATSPRATAA